MRITEADIEKGLSKSLTAEEVYKIANPSIVPHFTKSDISGAFDLIGKKLQSKLSSDSDFETKLNIDRLNNLKDRLLNMNKEINNRIAEVKGVLKREYKFNAFDIVDVETDAKILQDEYQEALDLLNVGYDGLYDTLRDAIAVKAPINKSSKLGKKLINEIITGLDTLLQMNAYDHSEYLELLNNPIYTDFRKNIIILLNTKKYNDVIQVVGNIPGHLTFETNEILKDFDKKINDSKKTIKKQLTDLNNAVKQFKIDKNKLEDDDKEELDKIEADLLKEKLKSRKNKTLAETDDSGRIKIDIKKTPLERIHKVNTLLKKFYTANSEPNKVIMFENIEEYNSVEELLEGSEKLLIIYRSSTSYGHWTCLFRNQFGYNYFNSYGTMIDESIKTIPEEFRKMSGQGYPHLLKLLSEANLPVFYNAVQLQSRDKKINTCGRWVGYCMLRCAGPNSISIEEFGNSFKKIKLGDRLGLDKTIVYLTEPFLRDEPDVKVEWV